MTTSSRAAYDNYHLRMDLTHGIGMNRFDANASNYMRQLKARASMPEPLKRLIAQLFKHGAITKCTITFGTRMDLEVSRTGDRGQLLMSSGALARFQQKFALISGRSVVASWAVNSAPHGRSSNQANYGNVASAFAGIIDAVADGLVLGAAIDQLFGDS